MALTYNGTSPLCIFYDTSGANWTSIYSGSTSTSETNNKAFSSFMSSVFPQSSPSVKYRINGTLTYGQRSGRSSSFTTKTITLTNKECVAGKTTYLLNESMNDSLGISYVGKVWVVPTATDIIMYIDFDSGYDANNKNYYGYQAGTLTITSIEVDRATELTSLKYGTTAVWGKAYTLSISAGANTTVTVNRTSSPNQHASTGNLSNGSLIYYGDALTISYIVSSGYAINTHTVNGTTFTSGSSFTVSSNISVVTTAQQAGPSWHTVWSGTTSIPYSYSGSYVTIKSGIGNSSATATRITGYAIVYESMGGDEYAPYDSVSWNGTTLPISQVIGSYSYIYLGIAVRMNGNDLQGYVNGVYDDYAAYITKVEQYY